MKLKILIAELTFQMMLTLGSIIYLINDYFQKDQISEIFIALFFVGLANIVGFVLRISVVKSCFHPYYFFGVIIFFLMIYLMSKFDPAVNFVMYFMQAGGFLINIYYLIYGYLTVKKLSGEMKSTT